MDADTQRSTFIITREDLTGDAPASLVTDHLRIGRSPDCDLSLDHPSVSPSHAVIGIGEHSRVFFILNVSPSDGMTVNGRDVRSGDGAFVADGDVVRLGPFLLSLRHDGHALHVRVSLETAPPAGEVRERTGASPVATSPIATSSCHRCGSRFPNGTTFCGRCGSRIAADAMGAPPRVGTAPERSRGESAAGAMPPTPQPAPGRSVGAAGARPSTPPPQPAPMPSPGAPRGGSPRGEEFNARLPLPPQSFVQTIGKKLHALTRKATRRAPDCDPVDCTVFSPPAVRRADSFMVQVFAHRPEQARAARELAQEFDGAAERRGFKSLEAEVRRGARLTIHLVIPGMEVADPVQSLKWQGRPEAVQFAVDVPAAAGRESAVGTVTVSEDGVPLGHVKFKVTVAAAGAGGRAEAAAAGDAARRYRKAFISYAAQDRAEVLKRVQMLARLNIKFFQDVIDLEPGARWEQQLYRHIDESDVFLLFWSSAAQQSEWVLNEVRYALARKRDDDTQPPEIIPVIIEGPPPVAPPPELAHLHFNDYLVYFMARPGV